MRLLGTATSGLGCTIRFILFITKFGQESSCIAILNYIKDTILPCVYNLIFTISCLNSTKLIITNLGVSCAELEFSSFLLFSNTWLQQSNLQTQTMLTYLVHHADISHLCMESVCKQQ